MAMLTPLQTGTALLAVANGVLVVWALILGLDLATNPNFWKICIALWVTTYVCAFTASVHVYDVAVGDRKFALLAATLAGLIVTYILFLSIKADPSGVQLGRFRRCIYHDLSGRSCGEFPSEAGDVTIFGSIGASTSSIMFIITAVLAYLYEGLRILRHDAATSLRFVDAVFSFVSCGFYAYVGIVSTAFHATHCYDWWRMDVGAVRAFAYVAGINVFAATPTTTYENQVKWHSLSLIIPVVAFTFTRAPFWTETENTGIIAAPGAIFCAASLIRDIFWRWRQHGGGNLKIVIGPAFVVTLWLAGGSALLIAQGERGACNGPRNLQPVALAHLTFAATPIALALMRDQQVPYMRLPLLCIGNRDALASHRSLGSGGCVLRPSHRSRLLWALPGVVG